MYRLAFGFSLFIAAAGLSAAPLPVTPYTVIARVTSFENVRLLRGPARFSQEAPHGSDSTLMAVIVFPRSLAGRDIAIPFESRREGRELLVQKGAVFRFEHTRNLADLRERTDAVYRRVIAFPPNGIAVLKPEGGVAEAYEGSLSQLRAAAAATQK
ncbi:MAG TPA: hypothetical protein VG734_26235 [Lacunisphaera sp.]|nr:hypothetical protein [Lacunisphaera sp.]